MRLQVTSVQYGTEGLSISFKQKMQKQDAINPVYNQVLRILRQYFKQGYQVTPAGMVFACTTEPTWCSVKTVQAAIDRQIHTRLQTKVTLLDESSKPLRIKWYGKGEPLKVLALVKANLPFTFYDKTTLETVVEGSLVGGPYAEQYAVFPYGSLTIDCDIVAENFNMKTALDRFVAKINKVLR